MFRETITHEFLEFQLNALIKRQTEDIKHETLIFLESEKVNFMELFQNPTDEKMLDLRRKLFSHLDLVINISKRLRILSTFLLFKDEARTIQLISHYYHNISSIAAYEFALWFQTNREDIFLLEPIEE